MLRQTIGKIWKLLPRQLRLRAVRATQTSFTVSVTAVIVNEHREVLLLNHVLRPRSGWGFPGGFLDAGEQPLDAIHREVREETGLEMHSVTLQSVRTVNRHLEVIFRAHATGHAAVRSREIYELAWFALDRLPHELSNDQRRLINSVLGSRFD